MSGRFWERDNDVAGVAYGQAILSDDYEDTLGNPEDEGHFEAYYRITVNDHLAITPDIQVISNALGDGDSDTILVGGVRGQLTF